MTPSLHTLSKRSRRGAKVRVRLSKARERSILVTLREMAPQTLLALSTVPPSANGLFANKAEGGRIKAKAYKAWIKAGLAELLTEQRAPLVKGRVSLSFVIERPEEARDLDNCIKPLCDLLVAAIVIEDDSKVDKIAVCWGDRPGVQIAVAAL